MDLAGYALIDRDAKTGVSPAPMSDFCGKSCRVIEFGAHDGGVLVMNDEGTAIGTFDKEDITASFRCSQQGEIVCPPDLDPIGQMMYVAKATGRKGGYNRIVRQLVIAASLHRGEFCDSLLWQKQ